MSSGNWVLHQSGVPGAPKDKRRSDDSVRWEKTRPGTIKLHCVYARVAYGYEAHAVYFRFIYFYVHPELRPRKPIPRVTPQPVNSTTFSMALCNTRSLYYKMMVLWTHGSMIQFGLSGITVLKNVIFSYNLDLFFLTETWLPPGDVSAFSELLPAGYLCLNTPRKTGRGGGIATAHRQSLKYHQ